MKAYFREWKTGEIGRIDFIKYYIFISAAMVISVFSLMYFIHIEAGVTNREIVNLENWDRTKAGMFGIPILFFILIGGFLGQANIIGKRIRDTGLSVFWTVMGIILSLFIIFIIWSTPEFSGYEKINNEKIDWVSKLTAVEMFEIFIALCLVLVPERMFNKGRRAR